MLRATRKHKPVPLTTINCTPILKTATHVLHGAAGYLLLHHFDDVAQCTLQPFKAHMTAATFAACRPTAPSCVLDCHKQPAPPPMAMLELHRPAGCLLLIGHARAPQGGWVPAALLTQRPCSPAKHTWITQQLLPATRHTGSACISTRPSPCWRMAHIHTSNPPAPHFPNLDACPSLPHSNTCALGHPTAMHGSIG
jgi:hypothetical protein